MSALEKLKKNTTIKLSATLPESKVFDSKKHYPTAIPMMNIALGGTIRSGLTGGILQIAGPSKHFKTAFGLLLTKTFLDAEPDGVVLFYDSEFGTPKSYFDTFRIDQNRVLHSPITDIEQLKFDIMAQLNELTKKDKVMIVIDSLGNLASKKEVEDALSEKGAADMTRAKQMKSLFRMITPHLTLKDIPCVVVNHIYMTQEMYSKPIVSGGTGGYYSADNIWIIGRQQEKEKDEVVGWNFVINIEKSRFVKEKSKIAITVLKSGGIDPFSGLLEEALDGGYLAKPSNGKYQKVDRATGELVGDVYKEDEFTGDFWVDLFKTTDFETFLAEKFCISYGDDAIVDEDEGATMKSLLLETTKKSKKND